MPLHLSALSRRQFLVRGTSALAGLSILRTGWTAEQTETVRFALLSDTHIPSEPETAARGVNMTANLEQVIAEVCSLKQKPAGVIINGDCAYLKGLPADYANFAERVAPLKQAGLPLHLTMGNHDQRETLYAALAGQQPDDPLVESKHVSLIETPLANLFLLDSLKAVNVVTGEIGPQQRQWLAQALDAYSDKPAIIMAHHNFQFTPPASGAVWGGIQDSEQLYPLLKDRPHVKAFIYGHTHNWNITEQDGIHFINLPPVAYVFGPNKPNGWVEAQFRKDGLNLQLHTIDPSHEQNGQQVALTWR